jgi:hypothetical protein
VAMSAAVAAPAKSTMASTAVLNVRMTPPVRFGEAHRLVPYKVGVIAWRCPEAKCLAGP